MVQIMMTAIFEQLEKYLKQNDENTFIIGGDFNTVLNENLDKRNGRIYSHKRCRTVINNIIDGYSLTDIWRDMHPDIKQFTWHSHHKPPLFCRLDHFFNFGKFEEFRSLLQTQHWVYVGPQ